MFDYPTVQVIALEGLSIVRHCASLLQSNFRSFHALIITAKLSSALTTTVCSNAGKMSCPSRVYMWQQYCM